MCYYLFIDYVFMDEVDFQKFQDLKTSELSLLDFK